MAWYTLNRLCTWMWTLIDTSFRRIDHFGQQVFDLFLYIFGLPFVVSFCQTKITFEWCGISMWTRISCIICCLLMRETWPYSRPIMMMILKTFQKQQIHSRLTHVWRHTVRPTYNSLKFITKCSAKTFYLLSRINPEIRLSKYSRSISMHEKLESIFVWIIIIHLVTWFQSREKKYSSKIL